MILCQLKKGIALFVSFAFLITNHFLPLPSSYASVESQFFSEAQSVFKIPQEFGQISEMIPVADRKAPLIIHLQTAHGVYDAQKNIEGILNYLQKNSDIKLLLLEGSGGKLSPKRMRLFPKHKEFNRQVIDRLTREGLLTGAESFLINGNESVDGWGIEEAGAYKQNRDAFVEAMDNSDLSARFLSRLFTQIEKITSPYLSKNLKEFLRRENSYQTGLLDLSGWLKFLNKQASRELKIDLDHAYFQKDWPLLVRYFRLEKAAKEIDSSKIENQAKGFIQNLKDLKLDASLTGRIEKLLTQKDLSVTPETGISGQYPVLNNAPRYSETRHLFDLLMRELPSPPAASSLPAGQAGTIPSSESSTPQRELPANFDFNRYPDLRLHIQHLILSSELDSFRLFDEVTRLADRIKDTLAKTEQETKALRLIHRYRLLHKLLNLELTREEYQQNFTDAAQNSPDILFDELNRFNGVKFSKELDLEGVDPGEIHALYETGIRFYEAALKRESIMMNNVRDRMETLKQNKAVLITGGFHSEAIKETAQRDGLNYVQITPNIREIAKDAKTLYIRSMLGRDPIPLSQVEKPSVLLDAAAFLQKVLTSIELMHYGRVTREQILALINTHPDSGVKDHLRARLDEAFPILSRTELRMADEQGQAAATFESRLKRLRENILAGISRGKFLTEDDSFAVWASIDWNASFYTDPGFKNHFEPVGEIYFQRNGILEILDAVTGEVLTPQKAAERIRQSSAATSFTLKPLPVNKEKVPDQFIMVLLDDAARASARTELRTDAWQTSSMSLDSGLIDVNGALNLLRLNVQKWQTDADKLVAAYNSKPTVNAPGASVISTQQLQTRHIQEQTQEFLDQYLQPAIKLSAQMGEPKLKGDRLVLSRPILYRQIEELNSQLMRIVQQVGYLQRLGALGDLPQNQTPVYWANQIQKVANLLQPVTLSYDFSGLTSELVELQAITEKWKTDAKSLIDEYYSNSATQTPALLPTQTITPEQMQRQVTVFQDEFLTPLKNAIPAGNGKMTSFGALRHIWQKLHRLKSELAVLNHFGPLAGPKDKNLEVLQWINRVEEQITALSKYKFRADGSTSQSDRLTVPSGVEGLTISPESDRRAELREFDTDLHHLDLTAAERKVKEILTSLKSAGEGADDLAWQLAGSLKTYLWHQSELSQPREVLEKFLGDILDFAFTLQVQERDGLLPPYYHHAFLFALDSNFDDGAFEAEGKISVVYNGSDDVLENIVDWAANREKLVQQVMAGILEAEKSKVSIPRQELRKHSINFWSGIFGLPLAIGGLIWVIFYYNPGGSVPAPTPQPQRVAPSGGTPSGYKRPAESKEKYILINRLIPGANVVSSQVLPANTLDLLKAYADGKISDMDLIPHLSDPDPDISNAVAGALLNVAMSPTLKPISLDALAWLKKIAEENPRSSILHQRARSIIDISVQMNRVPLPENNAGVRTESNDEPEDQIQVALKNLKTGKDRATSARILGNSNDPRAVPALIEAFESETHFLTRIHIFDSLRSTKDPRRIPILRTALGDVNSDIRWMAASSFVEIEDPEAVTGLIKLLSDEEWNARFYAAQALETQKALPAVAPLMERLNGEKILPVRTAIVNALGGIGDPQAIPVLTKLMRDETEDQRVRILSQRAIDEIQNAREGTEATPRQELRPEFKLSEDGKSLQRVVDGQVTGTYKSAQELVEKLKRMAIPATDFRNGRIQINFSPSFIWHDVERLNEDVRAYQILHRMEIVQQNPEYKFSLLDEGAERFSDSAYDYTVYSIETNNREGQNLFDLLRFQMEFDESAQTEIGKTSFWSYVVAEHKKTGEVTTGISFARSSLGALPWIAYFIEIDAGKSWTQTFTPSQTIWRGYFQHSFRPSGLNKILIAQAPMGVWVSGNKITIKPAKINAHQKLPSSPIVPTTIPSSESSPPRRELRSGEAITLDNVAGALASVLGTRDFKTQQTVQNHSWVAIVVKDIVYPKNEGARELPSSPIVPTTIPSSESSPPRRELPSSGVWAFYNHLPPNQAVQIAANTRVGRIMFVEDTADIIAVLEEHGIELYDFSLAATNGSKTAVQIAGGLQFNEGHDGLWDKIQSVQRIRFNEATGEYELYNQADAKIGHITARRELRKTERNIFSKEGFGSQAEFKRFDAYFPGGKGEKRDYAGAMKFLKERLEAVPVDQQKKALEIYKRVYLPILLTYIPSEYTYTVFYESLRSSGNPFLKQAADLIADDELLSLQKQLESPNEGDWVDAFEQMAALDKQGKVFNSPGSLNSNVHVHTDESYSFANVAQAVYWMWRAGLLVLGKVDHDTMAGNEMFYRLAQILRKKSVTGNEIRSHFKSGQKFKDSKGKTIFASKIIWNNPGVPGSGSVYTLAQGIPNPKHPAAVKMFDGIQGEIAPNLKNGRGKAWRNYRMIQGVNKQLRGMGISDVTLSYAAVYELTRRGNATDRHLMAALVNELEKTGDKKAQYYAAIFDEANLEVKPLTNKALSAIAKGDMDTPMKLLREVFLKPHNPKLNLNVPHSAFIAPDQFESPDIEEFAKNIIEAGGLPIWLFLGDKRGTGSHELEVIDSLFAYLVSIGYVGVGIMPHRNTDDEVKLIIAAAERHGLVVFSGVDINSKEMPFLEKRGLVEMPYVLTAVGVPYSPDVAKRFKYGADVMVGHEFLARATLSDTRLAGIGLNSSELSELILARKDRLDFLAWLGAKSFDALERIEKQFQQKRNKLPIVRNLIREWEKDRDNIPEIAELLSYKVNDAIFTLTSLEEALAFNQLNSEVDNALWDIFEQTALMSANFAIEDWYAANRVGLIEALESRPDGSTPRAELHKRDWIFWLNVGSVFIGLPLLIGIFWWVFHSHNGLRNPPAATPTSRPLSVTQPTSADVEYQKGVANFQQKRYDEAIANFTEVLRLDPKYYDAYITRAACYDFSERGVDAVIDLLKVLTMNPDSQRAAIARYNLNSFLKGSRRTPEELVLMYTKILEVYPNKGSAYYQRALAKIASNHSDEAGEDLLRAIASDPSFVGVVKNTSDEFSLEMTFAPDLLNSPSAKTITVFYRNPNNGVIAAQAFAATVIDLLKAYASKQITDQELVRNLTNSDPNISEAVFGTLVNITVSSSWLPISESALLNIQKIADNPSVPIEARKRAQDILKLVAQKGSVRHELRTDPATDSGAAEPKSWSGEQKAALRDLLKMVQRYTNSVKTAPHLNYGDGPNNLDLHIHAISKPDAAEQNFDAAVAFLNQSILKGNSVPENWVKAKQLIPELLVPESYQRRVAELIHASRAELRGIQNDLIPVESFALNITGKVDTKIPQNRIPWNFSVKDQKTRRVTRYSLDGKNVGPLIMDLIVKARVFYQHYEFQSFLDRYVYPEERRFLDGVELWHFENGSWVLSIPNHQPSKYDRQPFLIDITNSVLARPLYFDAQYGVYPPQAVWVPMDVDLDEPQQSVRLTPRVRIAQNGRDLGTLLIPIIQRELEEFRGRLPSEVPLLIQNEAYRHNYQIVDGELPDAVQKRIVEVFGSYLTQPSPISTSQIITAQWERGVGRKIQLTVWRTPYRDISGQSHAPEVNRAELRASLPMPGAIEIGVNDSGQLTVNGEAYARKSNLPLEDWLNQAGRLPAGYKVLAMNTVDEDGKMEPKQTFVLRAKFGVSDIRYGGADTTFNLWNVLKKAAKAYGADMAVLERIEYRIGLSGGVKIKGKMLDIYGRGASNAETEGAWLNTHLAETLGIAMPGFAAIVEGEYLSFYYGGDSIPIGQFNPKDFNSAEFADRLGAALTAVNGQTKRNELRFKELGKDELGTLVQNLQEHMKGGRSLAMIDAFLTKPKTIQEGTYYGIDFGGTNLRIVKTILDGKGGIREEVVYEDKIPVDVWKGTKEKLFDFIADKLIMSTKNEKGKVIAGFTFSFPVNQTGIDSGKLLRRTKKLEVPGLAIEDIAEQLMMKEDLSREAAVEGAEELVPDLVQLLRKAIERQGSTNIEIPVMLNDTIGTLLRVTYESAKYPGFEAILGAILGSGTNGGIWDAQTGRALNTEWGAFTGILAEWLDEIDREIIANAKPEGGQAFEKLISGDYLGEQFRRRAHWLMGHENLFKGQTSSHFAHALDGDQPEWGIKSEVLSAFIKDHTQRLSGIDRELKKLGISKSTVQERQLVKTLAENLFKRSARLAAAAVVATVATTDNANMSLRGARKGDAAISADESGIASPEARNDVTGNGYVAGIDGSLFKHNPFYVQAMEDAIRELVGDEKAESIKLVLAKDGSGVGAAIAAASVVSQRAELRTQGVAAARFSSLKGPARIAAMQATQLAQHQEEDRALSDALTNAFMGSVVEVTRTANGLQQVVIVTDRWSVEVSGNPAASAMGTDTVIQKLEQEILAMGMTVEWGEFRRHYFSAARRELREDDVRSRLVPGRREPIYVQRFYGDADFASVASRALDNLISQNIGLWQKIRGDFEANILQGTNAEGVDPQTGFADGMRALHGYEATYKGRFFRPGASVGKTEEEITATHGNSYVTAYRWGLKVRQVLEQSIQTQIMKAYDTAYFDAVETRIRALNPNARPENELHPISADIISAFYNDHGDGKAHLTPGNDFYDGYLQGEEELSQIGEEAAQKVRKEFKFTPKNGTLPIEAPLTLVLYESGKITLHFPARAELRSSEMIEGTLIPSEAMDSYRLAVAQDVPSGEIQLQRFGVTNRGISMRVPAAGFVRLDRGMLAIRYTGTQDSSVKIWVKPYVKGRRNGAKIEDPKKPARSFVLSLPRTQDGEANMRLFHLPTMEDVYVDGVSFTQAGAGDFVIHGIYTWNPAPVKPAPGTIEAQRLRFVKPASPKLVDATPIKNAEIPGSAEIIDALQKLQPENSEHLLILSYLRKAVAAAVFPEQTPVPIDFEKFSTWRRKVFSNEIRGILQSDRFLVLDGLKRLFSFSNPEKHFLYPDLVRNAVVAIQASDSIEMVNGEFKLVVRGDLPSLPIVPPTIPPSKRAASRLELRSQVAAQVPVQVLKSEFDSPVGDVRLLKEIQILIQGVHLRLVASDKLDFSNRIALTGYLNNHGRSYSVYRILPDGREDSLGTLNLPLTATGKFQEDKYSVLSLANEWLRVLSVPVSAWLNQVKDSPEGFTDKNPLLQPSRPELPSSPIVPTTSPSSESSPPRRELRLNIAIEQKTSDELRITHGQKIVADNISSAAEMAEVLTNLGMKVRAINDLRLEIGDETVQWNDPEGIELALSRLELRADTPLVIDEMPVDLAATYNQWYYEVKTMAERYPDEPVYQGAFRKIAEALDIFLRAVTKLDLHASYSQYQKVATPAWQRTLAVAQPAHTEVFRHAASEIHDVTNLDPFAQVGKATPRAELRPDVREKLTVALDETMSAQVLADINSQFPGDRRVTFDDLLSAGSTFTDNVLSETVSGHEVFERVIAKLWFRDMLTDSTSPKMVIESFANGNSVSLLKSKIQASAEGARVIVSKRSQVPTNFSALLPLVDLANAKSESEVVLPIIASVDEVENFRVNFIGFLKEQGIQLPKNFHIAAFETQAAFAKEFNVFYNKARELNASAILVNDQMDDEVTKSIQYRQDLLRLVENSADEIRQTAAAVLAAAIPLKEFTFDMLMQFQDLTGLGYGDDLARLMTEIAALSATQVAA